MYQPLIVVLIGVAVVVAGILWFRLHAFLALILASFVVAALTPAASLDRFFVGEAGFAVQHDSTEQSLMVTAKPGQIREHDRLMLVGLTTAEGAYADIMPVTAAHMTKDGNCLLVPDDADILLAGHQSLRAVPFEALKSARKSSKATLGEQVAVGFGKACLSIGIIIAMAGIIGKCLLESGAADRIVRTTVRWFGQPAAPIAFALSGFLLGVPVFFDTVFLLLIPLGKAMRVRTGRNYLLYVMTIVCGATMAHSLVPPTPGPLTIAQELDVNLGAMILGGLVVGLGTTAFGVVFAMVVNRFTDIPLRESADLSLAQLEEAAKRPDDALPSLGWSLTPILLPVILITADSLLETVNTPPTWMSALVWEQLTNMVRLLGDKNVCLTLSAAIAMWVLIRQRGGRISDLSEMIQSALAGAGVIILITAAGGSLGNTLRQTGIASLVQSLPQSSPAVLCILAFVLTTTIRAAQGSATVAMMTSAGIFSGLVQGGELGFHPLYLALTIGCGSKPLAWMNDSGFIVVTRISGLTETEGLKYITTLMTGMGLFGLFMILIGVSVWPNF